MVQPYFPDIPLVEIVQLVVSINTYLNWVTSDVDLRQVEM